MMYRWMLMGGAAAMLGGASWYFGRPVQPREVTPEPVVIAEKPVEAPRILPTPVIDVVDLSHSYEPAPEPMLLPGEINPASFITDPPQRIPAAVIHDKKPGSIIPASALGGPEHLNVEPREVHPWEGIPFFPGSDLRYIPMGVPFNTSISQEIPPNAAIANDLTNFTPNLTFSPMGIAWPSLR